MDMTLQERLEKLLEAYTRHFDIERDVSMQGGGFPATAVYHLREENYVATKAHVIYATEQHEYVYFYVAEHLDEETLRRQIALSREAGLAAIRPSGEHMFSFVTLVILADTIDPEATRLLKKTRYRKNFRLALHGWMEYHIAAMECSTQSFFSNPAGKEVRKTLERNFAPKAK
ncbi:hypothetical protein [Oscillibacter sp.]|uniref:hypothetical protein n=1 Tax=Oscillibacter sp. TaxID=1945593 RepID=UPI0026349901|nr:hypothetical protein [Oscillibacter sp.]MDD3346420.1 hypothetical protein [Oscillibacter sp.]